MSLDLAYGERIHQRQHTRAPHVPPSRHTRSALGVSYEYEIFVTLTRLLRKRKEHGGD